MINQPVMIGVTPAFDLEKGYYFIHPDNVWAVEQEGGIPVILPYVKNRSAIEDLSERIDGLYVTGGGDIDPVFFGAEPHPALGEVIWERDWFEIHLIQQMVKKRKPIFGVCRGAQVMNVALGGTLYQDLAAEGDFDLIQHMQKSKASHPTHHVTIKEGTLLYKILKKKTIRVNSRHHQANRKLGLKLRASAMTKDGVIEAVETIENFFMLGVQWHPENMARDGCPYSRKLYKTFINACRKRREQMIRENY